MLRKIQVQVEFLIIRTSLQRKLNQATLLPLLHIRKHSANNICGDIMTNSIWTNSGSVPSFPTLKGNAKTDILIVGGGLAGILCAYILQQKGADYILIESGNICSGVTRNTTAKITSQHGLVYHKLLRTFGEEKTKLYLKANENALSHYRTLCKNIDCDFEEKDSFVYTLDEPRKIEKELRALSRLDFSAEFADKLPLPFHTAGAVKFPHQAQFNPLKFVSAIAHGLNLFENTPLREFDGKYVTTPHGKIEADKIIIATHFPIINKHGLYPIKMYQHRSYVLALENAPDVNGMYVDESSNGLSFRNYGELLLLGGGGHRTGKQGSAWGELSAFSQTHYPESREICRWATQDCMTLDAVPYIGQYSKNTSKLYVASGFNKWGMTSSMAAAEILTDLVLGIDNPYAEVFSPSRSILHPQLALNAAESVINLLTLTSPRCPHLGCALRWNPYERSWDCPCHGSRFSHYGKLLDGPSNADIKRPDMD